MIIGFLIDVAFSCVKRSVTPTELGRRRHLSSTGSFDIDWSDPIQHLKEIDIPR